MNKKKVNTILKVFIVIGFFCVMNVTDVSAFRNIRRVKAIEFRGLKYLSKYEIIGNTVTKVEGDYVAVDIDSLSGLLEKNRMVASYRILIEGEHVRIIIAENEPVFLLCVKRNDKGVLFFELDRDLKVISYKRVHAYDKPLIIISDKDLERGVLSGRIVDLLRLLLELKANGLRVCDEISEIDLSNFVEARLYLHGRKTEFVLNPNWDSFYKLNYFVAYLDRIRYYPGILKLFNGSVVMK